MNIDLSSTFTAIFAFIINAFRSVLSWLDGIYIYNSNVSLLDLNIALAVFGVLFSALFVVVKNQVKSGISAADRAKKQRESK